MSSATNVTDTLELTFNLITKNITGNSSKKTTMNHFFTFALSFVMIFSITTCPVQNKLSQALSKPDGVIKLKIEYTPITNLPPAIGNLADLKTLYLFKNGLDAIPMEIGNLKNLETLVISSNNLKSLPSSIG